MTLVEKGPLSPRNNVVQPSRQSPHVAASILNVAAGTIIWNLVRANIFHIFGE